MTQTKNSSCVDPVGNIPARSRDSPRAGHFWGTATFVDYGPYGLSILFTSIASSVCSAQERRIADLERGSEESRRVVPPSA